MNVRLESLPALSLAAGALTAAMALGSRSYFEYAMFAVLVAASIFIVLRGGRRAPGTFLVGLSVAAASFFMTMTPPVPAEYVGGGEALYTLSIDKTFNGQASLRCEATALARDGKECRPFRCSVIVMDVLSGLSEGDVVCLRGEPEPVGMFADVPYMDAEEMFVRAGGISAVFKTSIDGVTVVGRHDDIRLRMTSLRDRAALALYSSELPTDVSSTLATALLGADAPPPGVKERFRSAGLSHLLCISGFHIFIIAGMISFLLYPASVESCRQVTLFPYHPARMALCGIHRLSSFCSTRLGHAFSFLRSQADAAGAVAVQYSRTRRRSDDIRAASLYFRPRFSALGYGSDWHSALCRQF